MTMESYHPEKGYTLWIAAPDPNGGASRCVVLRAKLATCGEACGLDVSAYELAHAFLRNGGWGEITDREEAADALAESWGFPKPNFPRFA